MVSWSSDNAEMAKTHEAMLRAALRAREIAISSGTSLAVWRDGRVVLVSPSELAARSPQSR
jgi:hypothetical protein